VYDTQYGLSLYVREGGVMDKTVYLISDLHLGPGRDAATGAWDPLEDFKVDSAFEAFLDRVSAEAGTDTTELIIAGDFIDYPQILPDLAFTSPLSTRGATQAESAERTRVVLGQRPDVASGHPAVFARLRRFMEDGHSVTFLAGNHDIDLLWPEVWDLIFDAIYPPGAAGTLRRESYSLTIGTAPRGRVYVEHGHERDPENYFGGQMAEPFGDDGTGTLRLKRCYGTQFVDKVYNQLERERWFIDNVKPISRVIALGLKNDFFFTGSALALILKFFLTSGAPPKQLVAVLAAEEASWPIEQRTGDNVVAAVSDDELRAYVERRLAEPAFRAEFEREVDEFAEEDWQKIEAGVQTQPSLDQAAGMQDGAMVLGEEKEDYYRATAREVFEEDPAVTTVVMGHTHFAIDGLTNPIYVDGGRTGYYFNSGTWTPHLRDRQGRSYSWAEIGDAANYTSSLTYLRFVPDASGEYRAELHNWAAEM
jgi:UDP-2,3-diacylglucosamine pyrophosphatase LpxH